MSSAIRGGSSAALPSAARADLTWLELGEIGIAQHKADIGMGDEPALSSPRHRRCPSGRHGSGYHIPDVLEIDLGHADAGVPAGSGNRQRHVRLGLAPEIDRAVVDLVGDGDLEPVVGREVDAAADAVFA